MKTMEMFIGALPFTFTYSVTDKGIQIHKVTHKVNGKEYNVTSIWNSYNEWLFDVLFDAVNKEFLKTNVPPTLEMYKPKISRILYVVSFFKAEMVDMVDGSGLTRANVFDMVDSWLNNDASNETLEKDIATVLEKDKELQQIQ